MFVFCLLLSLSSLISSTYLPWLKCFFVPLSLSPFSQWACAGTCSLFLNELGLKSAGHSTSIQQAADVTQQCANHRPPLLPLLLWYTLNAASFSLFYLPLTLISPLPLSCFAVTHTFISVTYCWILPSYLGPYTSSYIIQPLDYPSFDLPVSHSLTGKSPESKGAFGCSPLLLVILSPFSNGFCLWLTELFVWISSLLVRDSM